MTATARRRSIWPTASTTKPVPALLTPVSQFVSDIKRSRRIRTTRSSSPASSRQRAPTPSNGCQRRSGQNTQAGELWPVRSSTPAARQAAMTSTPWRRMNPTDGSFGDPGVRSAQFLNAFTNSVLASICDASYASSMQAIATKLGQLITPPCITGKIQTDSQGQPMCSVVEHLVDMQNNKKDIALQNCNENGGALPCWTLSTGAMNCSGAQLNVMDPPGTTTTTRRTARSTARSASRFRPGRPRKPAADRARQRARRSHDSSIDGCSIVAFAFAAADLAPRP